MSVRRIVQTVRKLRGRSLTELRVRGRQALAAYFERVGVTDSGVAFDEALSLPATPEQMLARFRDETRERPFEGLANRGRTVAALRSQCPAAEREILDRAERAARGRFDLLGFRDLSFGDPIDWLADPVADRRSPSIHWSRVPFLNYESVGDHKIVWELNRHQYLVTLGQAYWYTGDERFAKVFATHVTQWLETNPPKLGINWASSLEVAFRAISWTWALQLFRDSPELSPSLFASMLASLSVHARHLEMNLSTYFSPNTHLTGEALGLLYIARNFPELARASEWEHLGRSILFEQLSRQVRADGVYFEQSSYYHRYTVDFFLHVLQLERPNGGTPPAVVETLRKLLDHLMFLARPDGTWPLFGDDDGGRLLFLDPRRSDDFRPSLSTGAVVFRSPEYAFVSNELSAETIWLTGPNAVNTWSALSPRAPSQSSAAFGASGFYVMRDGWTRTADTMLIDCGPHGILNCGHAHADALAIEVVARGETMIADPGTFTYTASLDLRNHFRSSLAHSAVSVDGESSSRPGTPFTWETKARSTTHRWYADDTFDFFEGSHDGFERLPDPVEYRRVVLFVKGDYWIVRDTIRARGNHTVTVGFQTSAGTSVELLSPRGVRVRASRDASATLDIVSTGRSGAFRIADAWTSQVYGARTRAANCAYVARTGGPATVTTCLLPRTGGEGRWDVADASDESNISLVSESLVDSVAFNVHGTEARFGDADVDVDADVWWTRRSRPDGPATRCIAIGVRALRVGARSLVPPGESVDWLVAERRGEKWAVRSPDPVRLTR
jgi:hypothetical protein